jgi:septal ring factor EnvC (AmiA/AmiB activator)
MNTRIEKIRAELEKTRERIAKNQLRQRELERQLLEAENADIIAAVRSMEVRPEELAQLIKNIKGGQLEI